MYTVLKKQVYKMYVKGVVSMVDNFEVESKFEDRQHKRHQFKLVIDKKEFKGDYHDGKIQWLNPHPQQSVNEDKLQAIENEVYDLLNEQGLTDDTEDLEIEAIENNQSRKLHMFKLKIQGESYKGTFQNGVIEWFHPKPIRKLKDERVEKIEEKVQEKMKERFD